MPQGKLKESLSGTFSSIKSQLKCHPLERPAQAMWVSSLLFHHCTLFICFVTLWSIYYCLFVYFLECKLSESGDLPILVTSKFIASNKVFDT